MVNGSSTFARGRIVDLRQAGLIAIALVLLRVGVVEYEARLNVPIRVLAAIGLVGLAAILCLRLFKFIDPRPVVVLDQQTMRACTGFRTKVIPLRDIRGVAEPRWIGKWFFEQVVMDIDVFTGKWTMVTGLPPRELRRLHDLLLEVLASGET